MADFTRFDFHALRFTESENVQAMTAEEVGQYMLLLVKAWLTGKNATLPDDPEFLARVARVPQISDKVMRLFEKVDTDWGPRLANETLSKEWDKTMERSEAGRRSVEVRWKNKRDTNVIPTNNDRTKSVIPKPYQAVPNQTIPDQAVPPRKNGDE